MLAGAGDPTGEFCGVWWEPTMSWSCFWISRTVFLSNGSGKIVCVTVFGAAMSVWEEGVHSDGMLGGY